MFTFFLLLIVFSLLAFGFLIFLINDFSIPTLDITKITGKSRNKILVFYPHPDDETMSAGAFIASLVKAENKVKVITITTGQYGTELLNLPPDKLGKVREKEFIKAMNELGVNDYEFAGFVDGNVKNSMEEVKVYIDNQIKEFMPDILLTYEKFGVYGHPDHIALSKAVFEVSQRYSSIKVLYSTISEKQQKAAQLPTSINGVPIPKTDRPANAQFRISTLKYCLQKYRAAKAHKSQNLSGKFPLLLLAVLNLNEYFTLEFERSNV